MKKKIIHLHWVWYRGSSMLRGVTFGYTVCGHRVESALITSHPDDASCPECLAAAEAWRVGSQEPGPITPSGGKR